MPKITWLGDEPCIWNEVTFPAGVPVETDDPYMIGKARHNPFFRLDEAPESDLLPEFDDPKMMQKVFGGPMPETWTNDPPKRKRGRPPKVRHNGDQ